MAMANIELPKDAEGREIPLDVDALYDKNGNRVEVFRWNYVRGRNNNWTFNRMFEFATVQLCPQDYFLTPPDSWEKLEEDLQRITADPTEWFCMYAGHDKRDTGCRSNCSNCKFFKDNMSCEKQAVLDIVFRIRKLRGEG